MEKLKFWILPNWIKLSAGTDSYNFRYVIILAGVSIILQVLALTISTFPFFQFFAFVPVIGICRYLLASKIKLSWEIALVFIIIFTLPAFWKFIYFKFSLSLLMAGISPVAAILLWYYSSTVLNSLKSLYLIIFWLGIEYVFIAIEPPVLNHLPGTAFRLWGESMVYIRYTGFQGTTLWLLLTNILFAQSLFQPDGRVVKRINRSFFLYATGIGVLPMAISMFSYEGWPDANLTSFFANPSAHLIQFNYEPFYSFYMEYGEYLGKLGFWLSIIIMLSLVVKRFRSGNGNKN